MEFIVRTLYAKKNRLGKQNMFGEKQKMTLARKYCIHGGHWKRTLRSVRQVVEGNDLTGELELAW